MSDFLISGKGNVNIFEQYQKEQNLRFKLEKLLDSNSDRPYHEQFFISISRADLEILVKKLSNKEN